MPISIGTNISSLMAQRRFSESSKELSKTYERLSSGMRVNKGSDDPAGLAISSALKTDSRVYSQGIRNFNDGLSLLNIADSALNELSNITTRLSELATQAANGTFSNTQRAALDTEAQALTKEYFRISRTTKFNDKSLFDGSLNELRLQGGYGITGGFASTLGGAIGTGTFGTAISSEHDADISGYGDFELGDINGDGLLDLVSAGNQSGQDYINVKLGQGGGAFGAYTQLNGGIAAIRAVALGDINNDGVLDLATFGGPAVYIRVGNGDGTFQNATSYSAETTGYDVALKRDSVNFFL